jgi:anti-sigma B factor antagonist
VETGLEGQLATGSPADDFRSKSIVDPSEFLDLTVSDEGPATEIRLRGELDMSTAPLLRDLLVRVASEGTTQVTLDLAGLAFIDSTGLSVLITGLKRLRQQGGDMTLRSPTAGTRKVLEITGLTEVFAIS